jgi:TonB-linked SusC/RagA family outer membrane protein
MRKLTLLLLGVVLFVGTAFAQRTISGVVADEKGNALPNVSVVVRGSTTGTTTKTDGSFTLSVPANATAIVFSSVGMIPKEVSLTSVSAYTVRLESAAGDLSEVVVVGYGSAKKKSEVAGSLTTVDAKRIQERPSANAFDALQGKVAGLQVFTSSGEPSASSSLRLHGVGSLTSSNTPLYVMDGIPVDAGSIVSLNPEDFESVTVLKDASATSIYGSRAANGVIYLTTKKGNANTSTIELKTQYASSSLISTTEDLYNSFMNTKQLTDFWIATGYRTQAQVNTLLATYPFDTKWYKAFYKDNQPTYNVNLNMSGGSGKTTYYISGSYFKQEGLTYRSGFDRYTVRANINSNITNWLRVGINASGGYDRRQTNPYGSNSLNRGLSLLNQPFYSPVDANGNKYPDVIPGLGRYSPEYLQDKITSQGDNLQLNPTGFVQITPIKNLILKSQAGIDFYDYRITAITYPSYLGSLNNGAVREDFQRNVYRTITNTAEYTFKVKSIHNFVLLAGQEFNDTKYTSFFGSSNGQTDDRLVLIDAGPNTRNAGSSKTENAYLSYFGRLNYNFDTKYFIDLSVREDQSSRFGINNRSATFWSVGVMWNAKKEKFLQSVNWLTDLSVKASIGTSGNSAIGNYDSYGTVTTTINENASGWLVSAPGNPSLTWENQRMTNIGFNFTLFNRGHFNIDLYDRRTTDMLFSVPYPYTSGFANVQKNIGENKNTGIDVFADWDIVRKKDFYITPSVNFNINKNEVTELFDDRKYWIIPNTGVSFAVGQPVSFFYPIWAGVNPANGDATWYLPDPNPNNIINRTTDKGTTNVFNATSLQQSTGIKRYPPFTGGFGLNAGYKGVFFNTDFSFASGKYLINNDRYFFENPNQFAGYNQSTVILDYWKQAGDVTRFPRYGVQFTQFDSRLIENASFMRIKNLTLGYNLPKSVLAHTGFIKGAKFYVTGRNLVTWTKYTGPDPEVDSNLSLGANPNTKQVAVGIDLTF